MVLCYHYIILLVPTQCTKRILDPSEYVKKEIVLYGFLNILDPYSTYPGLDVNEGKP
jgi:hypothetical protein